MPGESVRIVTQGVPQLKRALRQMDPELAKEFRSGFKAIAEKVAADIRPKVPRRSGRAAGSVHGVASGVGGGVAFGGTDAPYYPWLDFGGTVGRGHRPGQPYSGAIVREYQGNPYGEGRYVYPTIREDHDMIIEEVGKLVENACDKADLQTKGSF